MAESNAPHCAANELHCAGVVLWTKFCGNGPVNGCCVEEETTMAWTTPTLVEICIGLEINGYLPAEF
jgi:coenzyme PQQ precursor peptide PqqA